MAVSMGDELRVRCYVCGHPVAHNEKMALASLSQDADRVFVLHTERCLARLECEGLVLLVRSVNQKKRR